MDRNTNKSNRGNRRHRSRKGGTDVAAYGLDFNSARALIGSGYRANDLTVVSRSLDSAEIDRLVKSGQRVLVTGSGNKVNGATASMNLTQIPGGIKQVLALQALILLLVNLIVQAIQAAITDKKLVVKFDAEDFKATFIARIQEVYGTITEISLDKILYAFGSVSSASRYGKWSMETPSTTRFIAAVLSWTYGRDWLNANFTCDVSNTTTVTKPESALAVYYYQTSELVETGQPFSVAIPTSRPIAICVLGMYPNGQGGYTKSPMGLMKNTPMVVDKSTPAPRFIRHTNRKPATNDIVAASIGNNDKDINTMFLNPTGKGNFVFTTEVVTMMTANPNGFVEHFSGIVAITNGFIAAAKRINTARVAAAAAISDLQEQMAQDCETDAPSSGMPNLGLDRVFASTPTLVGATS